MTRANPAGSPTWQPRADPNDVTPICKRMEVAVTCYMHRRRSGERLFGTDQHALVAIDDDEGPAGVAAAGAHAAGAAGAQRGRYHGAAVRLLAHGVGHHLQSHLAQELILRDARVCGDTCRFSPIGFCCSLPRGVTRGRREVSYCRWSCRSRLPSPTCRRSCCSSKSRKAGRYAGSCLQRNRETLDRRSCSPGSRSKSTSRGTHWNRRHCGW